MDLLTTYTAELQSRAIEHLPAPLAGIVADYFWSRAMAQACLTLRMTIRINMVNGHKISFVSAKYVDWTNESNSWFIAYMNPMRDPAASLGKYADIRALLAFLFLFEDDKSLWPSPEAGASMGKLRAAIINSLAKRVAVKPVVGKS